MSTKITRKDILLTLALLFTVFILFPFGAWCLSLYREHIFKQDIKKIASAVIVDVQPDIQRASDLMVEQVTTTPGVNSNKIPYSFQPAIEQMCDAISSSISAHNDKFTSSDYHCTLFIKRGDTYTGADSVGTYRANYTYDLQDFSDLERTPDQWRLYPNGQYYRVKYKVRSEPLMILDFEVKSKEVDYGYR